MSGDHEDTINAALTTGKGQSLIEINDDQSFIDEMGELAKTISERIRRRLAEMRMLPADLARLLGYSPQRINNYIHQEKPRAVDVETLVKIARHLQTTPDWLLGLNEAEQTVKTPADDQRDVERLIHASGPIVQNLLGLVELPSEKADAVAHAAQEALRALLTFSDDTDAQTRARLAAQLAWQFSQRSKPS